MRSAAIFILTLMGSVCLYSQRIELNDRPTLRGTPMVLLKLCERPEAAQLLRSLLAYAASEQFNPATRIDLATLRRIMGILVVHA